MATTPVIATITRPRPSAAKAPASRAPSGRLRMADMVENSWRRCGCDRHRRREDAPHPRFDVVARLFGVADDGERVAVGDRVALANRQLGDDAGLVRGDLVLHLHRLDDRDDVAFGHLLAGLHRDLPDAALHRRGERVAAARAAARAAVLALRSLRLGHG